MRWLHGGGGRIELLLGAVVGQQEVEVLSAVAGDAVVAVLLAWVARHGETALMDECGLQGPCVSRCTRPVAGLWWPVGGLV